MFSQIMFTFGQVEARNSFMHALLVTWTTTNKPTVWKEPTSDVYTARFIAGHQHQIKQ